MTIDLKKLWQDADAVCFDVDSTLCVDEGIDELAAFCGVGDEVASWTNKAMSGGVSFREALDERLKIINPTKRKLEDFVQSKPSQLTPGVKELISLLFRLKKDVYLISGGFESIILPVAQELHVDEKNIYANKLLFDDKGKYVGFDESRPTSSSGGKKVVVEKIKSDYHYKKLVMIGDGMTDLETYPSVHLFIGFGGNRIRENLRAKAPWFVTDFKVLTDALL